MFRFALLSILLVGLTACGITPLAPLEELNKGVAAKDRREVPKDFVPNVGKKKDETEKPADPVDNTDPEEPVDPTDPDETTDPVDPADPTDPVDPTDPEPAKEIVGFCDDLGYEELKDAADDGKACMAGDGEVCNDSIITVYCGEGLECTKEPEEVETGICIPLE